MRSGQNIAPESLAEDAYLEEDPSLAFFMYKRKKDKHRELCSNLLELANTLKTLISYTRHAHMNLRKSKYEPMTYDLYGWNVEGPIVQTTNRGSAPR